MMASQAKKRVASPLKIPGVLESELPIKKDELSAICEELCEHKKACVQVMMTSKESIEKRKVIEATIRAYEKTVAELKEAYLTLATEREFVLWHVTNVRGSIKTAVEEVVQEVRKEVASNEGNIKELIREELGNTKGIKELVQNEIKGILNGMMERNVEEIGRMRQEYKEGCENLQVGMANTIRKEVGEIVEAKVASGGAKSYAEMAEGNWVEARGRKKKEPVKIPRGPTLDVDNMMSVVIEPTADARGKYESSEAVKKKLMETINPLDYGLKVARVAEMRDKSTRIVARAGDIEKLKKSSALSSVGLVVKERTKYLPRVMVHDVPGALTDGEVIESLIELNLEPERRREMSKRVRIVFRQAVDKEGRGGCVVEMEPGLREKIIGLGKVFIKWAYCKVVDYVKVVQCFKCMGFGHISTACKRERDICGLCAGEHETRKCDKRNSTLKKCTNCIRARMSDIEHSAFDTSKCPIMVRKLKEKIQRTNYGE